MTLREETPPPGLAREQIIAALTRLNELLADANVIGEICLFGGTAMVLVFNARLSTRNVDAIFKPAALMRELAGRVAEEHGLSPTWRNDRVKGFQSNDPEVTQDSVSQYSHLRVFRPTAPYLLAMKWMAARTADVENSGDKKDIRILIEILGLASEDEVIQIVTRFFPVERVLPKTQFIIHEVINEVTRK